MLDDDFLLTTPLARDLYHGVARDLAIIDYHNHLDPQALAEDRTFANLAQLWIISDPYKHRAMRIAGFAEADITGASSDRKKFDHWAATVPLTLGNPLHPWTALELDRTFGITEPLTPESAERIWETANAQLARSTHSARQLLALRGTACVCTSDRLLDDLSHHAVLAASDFPTRVLPSLRADDITAIDSPGYVGWLRELGEMTGIAIRDYENFRVAAAVRLDAFEALGCRLSDHALDDFRFTEPGDTAELFGRVVAGESLTDSDSVRLRSGLLRDLGVEYARRGWILQLHLGAQRRTSSRLRRLVGPAGGYACPGNATDIPSLCALLDAIETAAGELPRTNLYPLNPVDFPALATMTGSYASDGVPGLVQLGPAWWYNDHASGIRQHLDALSSYGLLATFIGMTTDSRSLLSLVRHEYFRRVLCAWLGELSAAGHLPSDANELAPLVRAVCHDNAARALGFD